MNTLFRRRVLLGSARPTPTGIPYIRGGSNGSYIDTGIVPDSTTRVIVWARNFNPRGGTLFGYIGTGNLNCFGIGAWGSANIGRIGIFYGDYKNPYTYVDNAFRYLANYHKYELDGRVLKVDGVTLATAPESTVETERTIHLFGYNNDSTHTAMSKSVDICACKIYKNGVLVRDYTPTRSPVVGFYDAVSDTTFANLGSGSFSYGVFDFAAYTPLEYITDSGASYFDMGIKGTYSMILECKFMPTSNSSTFHELLGYRSASSCCCIGLGNDTTANSRVYWRFGTNETVTYPVQTSTSYTNSAMVAYKANATVTVYRDHTSLGSAEKTGVSTSFQTADTLYLGRTHNHTNSPFIGRLYYCGIQDIRNYVPAKVNNRAGMYDTYNDVFYVSMSSTDFGAGPEIVTSTPFQSKNVTILGDSISTFDEAGYKYGSYRMYYPKGDVDSVDKTYWKKLIDTCNSSLVVNLSYSGSCATNVRAGEGYPSLCDRLSLIGNCDVLVLALGTNDYNQAAPLGEYSYDKAVNELSEGYFREALIKAIKTLNVSNPNLQIYLLILNMGETYRASIREIGEHYNLAVVDTRNDYQRYNGSHPDSTGMIEIFNYFLRI